MNGKQRLMVRRTCPPGPWAGFLSLGSEPAAPGTGIPHLPICAGSGPDGPSDYLAINPVSRHMSRYGAATPGMPSHKWKRTRESSPISARSARSMPIAKQSNHRILTGLRTDIHTDGTQYELDTGRALVPAGEAQGLASLMNIDQPKAVSRAGRRRPRTPRIERSR